MFGSIYKKIVIDFSKITLLFLLILIIVASINLLTELTSNMATTAMLLPVLVTMALAINIHPYFLLVSATLAASCAFMLPVATPPNAIVFGSGLLKIEDMFKKGVWMNLFSIIIILFTFLSFFAELFSIGLIIPLVSVMFNEEKIQKF